MRKQSVDLDPVGLAGDDRDSFHGLDGLVAGQNLGAAGQIAMGEGDAIRKKDVVGHQPSWSCFGEGMDGRHHRHDFAEKQRGAVKSVADGSHHRYGVGFIASFHE